MVDLMAVEPIGNVDWCVTHDDTAINCWTNPGCDRTQCRIVTCALTPTTGTGH